ncbi:cytochrome C oxidase subunit IV family protein [Phnomibacter sp. MR]|uniref:cytochrome C oxidase subunit IV family protein n=1 Tax=Phnomibacter sp. MR TaxID=3042318 RepID=UPI003A80142D
MSHSSPASSEISFVQHHDDGTFKKTVRKVTIILSVVTIIELLCGLAIFKLGHGSPMAVLMIKGLVTILSLAKAFYITSYFMHLGDEIRNFIMTIIVPLLLFVWFIAAFLIDGNSWRTMKNTEAGSKPAPTEQVEKGVAPGAEK